MNVLITKRGQAEYKLAQYATQSPLIERVFINSSEEGNSSRADNDKICHLSFDEKDAQALQTLINDNNIALCIHNTESSKALFALLDHSIPSANQPSPTTSNQEPLSYTQSGVNIDEGNSFVDKIKPLVKATYRQETETSLGAFSGASNIPEHYRSPLLVAATDGVGTKLKWAVQLQQHQHIGIDLVAMCVNDLIVCGAEPLFFLDYYATSKLDSETAHQVVAGICEGCKIAGCSLIGGETAEMPGIYQENDYDLAGFSVGVVEREEIIDGSTIKTGDVVLGLASSGIHSNGYSLVRAVINHQAVNLQHQIGDKTLAQWLLTPTKIYAQDILNLKNHLPHKAIKGLAHITGGGLVENIPRILPQDTMVEIDPQCWQMPAIFTWLQQQGNIAFDEMWRVFNMGIGMAIILDPQHLQSALNYLKPLGATQIGVVNKRHETSSQCIINYSNH